MTTIEELDARELFEPGPRPSSDDALSMAIGSEPYANDHVLGSRIHPVTRVTQRFRVARFYFLAAPRTAIDFEHRAGTAAEQADKRAWCRAQGIRYEVLKDRFDIAPFVGTGENALVVADQSETPARRRGKVQTPRKRAA